MPFLLTVYLLFDFYSHAPRGARLDQPVLDAMLIISTHTPLAGRDNGVSQSVRHRSYFYSHAPRGARRHVFGIVRKQNISTHTPLAGRDEIGYIGLISIFNFYSHAPRGARLMRRSVVTLDVEFLLTRPSRGATKPRITVNVYQLNFYSHAPRGARPVLNRSLCGRFSISTHTPLAGRDT